MNQNESRRDARLTRPEGFAPVLFVILFGEFVHADVVRHHGAQPGDDVGVGAIGGEAFFQARREFTLAPVVILNDGKIFAEMITAVVPEIGEIGKTLANFLQTVLDGVLKDVSHARAREIRLGRLGASLGAAWLRKGVLAWAGFGLVAEALVPCVVL